MNTAIIELQRDLLLEQLMEVENQLNDSGIKNSKKGFTLFMRNDVFYVKYTDPLPEPARVFIGISEAFSLLPFSLSPLIAALPGRAGISR